MKLIIAGSRELNVRHDELFEILSDLGIVYKVTEIVCGCARGIDSDGREFAKRYKIKVKEFPADWTKYGSLAGHRRNLEMAVYGDALLLIWDGSSRGSANMKARMQGLKKPIYEVVRKNIE
jgi:hypothetical protein